MSFYEIPMNTTHVGHTRSMCHRQERQVLRLETALAALAAESDTDLEETAVQEILLAHKESRQSRGEQRVNRGYRPATKHTSSGKPYRVEGRLNIKELISRTRCRICREKGHWALECPNKGKQMLRDGEEVNTSFFVFFRRRPLHTTQHREKSDRHRMLTLS